MGCQARCRPGPCSCTPGQLQQQIPERLWCRGPLTLAQILQSASLALANARDAPFQIERGFAGSNPVQPRRLAGRVPVVLLVQAATPSAAQEAPHPSARPRRLRQSENRPSVAIGRMFEHAAPPTHGREGRGKATAVVSRSPRVGVRRSTAGIAAPPRTGRMSHDRMRASINAGISGLIPRVNSGQAKIGSSGCDKQSCNHAIAPMSAAYGSFSL
jgi:hypothetical protein